MSITSLSPQQLRQAADLQEKILELQSQLTGLLGGEVPAPVTQEVAVNSKPAKGKKGKRTFSAESRAKMAAAQKARWAAKKGVKPEATTPEPEEKPKKRTVSPAHKKALLKALAKAREARWGKLKAGNKAKTPTATTVKEPPKKKKKPSPALLKALEGARAARSAKAKAARNEVPF